MPKAYIVVNIDVHDDETYARYRALTPANIAKSGGRFLVRGGKVENWEGDFGFKRFVILEFPSAEAARAWYNGPEYQEILKLRIASATSDLAMVEGFDG